MFDITHAVDWHLRLLHLLANPAQLFNLKGILLTKCSAMFLRSKTKISDQTVLSVSE